MDSGHVKQVAAFEKLLGFCNAHGAMFNPSKVAIQSTALSTLLTLAHQSLEAVRTARAEYSNTVNARNEVFRELPKFMTRIINTLAASGASRSTVDEAYFYIKKFYHSFRTKKVSASVEAGVPTTPATRSISQLDFDSKVNNFEGLVKVVSLEASYQPNEPDLQIASLTAFASRLRGLNTAVVNAQIRLSNVRATRNKFLYASMGIHGIAQSVKRYVKAVFGYQSVAYYQIRGLRFLIRKHV